MRIIVPATSSLTSVREVAFIPSEDVVASLANSARSSLLTLSGKKVEMNSSLTLSCENIGTMVKKDQLAVEVLSQVVSHLHRRLRGRAEINGQENLLRPEVRSSR